jgi:peroxiredoxin
MQTRPAARRTAILITVGIAIIVIGAGVIIAVRSTNVPKVVASGPVQAAVLSPDALSRAADEAGFRTTMGSNVGLVENLPMDTTLEAPSPSLLRAGLPAPDFALQTPAGQVVKLSDFKGKTVLLEFFATWCPHCQAEADHLIRLYSQLPKEKYQFLSVNADSEDAGSIYAYERFFKIPWPTLLDPGSPTGSFKASGGFGPVTHVFGVALYPTFYIIDSQGRIAWRSDREQPDALIFAKLKDASGT